MSAETVESEDLSDLISSLARDQALELDLPVTDARVSVSSFLTSSSQEMPDVSDAVNNILNDLSSGDDSISESINSTSVSSMDIDINNQDSGDNKLYPIFYKGQSSATSETSSVTSNQSVEKKKFVCSSLSDNQAIIDAGQKTIGE